MLATLFAPIDVTPTPTKFTSSDTAAVETYNAVSGGNRRVSIIGSNKSEDRLLSQNGRRRLSGNARDLVRNFSVVSWAVRRHLDYVTQFTFHGETNDKGFNKAIEELVESDSRKERFDIAERHDLESMTRLLESHATIDGDCGLVKLSDGHAQGIEGDRVRDPQGQKIDDNWIQGIRTNPAGGKSLAYAVHKRTRGSYLEFERMVPAQNMIWHASYGRLDQTRGIGPITSSLNLFRDVHENFDYALAKMKIHQIFAIAALRNPANDESPGQLTGGEDSDGNEDKSDYAVDFGRGPAFFDADKGDDFKIIESNTPSNEFQMFSELVIMAALKGLDIPYSFYDESHTNFFGSRGAWFHYQRSCRMKIRNLANLLDDWTLWRLQLRILDGSLVLPSKKILSDMDWTWVPRGTPWWDPSKEVIGDVRAMAAGLDNPQRICREKDRGNFYDNIDKIAEAKAYADSKGVTLSFDVGVEPQQVEVTNAESK